MATKTKIKTKPHRAGPLWNSQSNAFPSVSVSAENPEMAEFVFRKMARGSRKALYKGGRR